MKRFLKRRFLGIPLVAIVAIVVMATTALAAWAVMTLTSTGTITVVHSPYSVSSTALAFGDTEAITGGVIDVTSGEITITNHGVAPIGRIAVELAGVPVGLTATDSLVGIFPLATDQSATLTVTLTGTAPGEEGQIDLSSITATLTPAS